MRILLIEGAGVIRGEQLVGALADLGVNPSTFEWELSKLDTGDFHMHFEREHGPDRAGVAFSIHPGATHQDHDHPHDHDEHHHDEHHHGEHHHGDPAHGHEPAHAHAEALNLAGLRKRVENSDLPDRSKTLSLALLSDLETTLARPGHRPDAAGDLSKPELSLLAQVVLVAVGIDQLRVDQVEIAPVRHSPHEHTRSGTGAGAGKTVSLDPLIASLEKRLPRTGSLAGLRRVQSGVGVSAAETGHPGARIEACLLES